MRERPILMTPANAAKCRDGTKTQTRRVVKFPVQKGVVRWEPFDTFFKPIIGGVHDYYGNRSLDCPYGIVGEHLWVREKIIAQNDVMVYAADRSVVQQDGVVWPSLSECRVIPSIHVPRWACRTILEIVAVRVQRVQEIRDEDCYAEGVVVRPDAAIAARIAEDTPARMEFGALWTSIHGPGSWGANPFVWVIHFKRVML